MRRRSPAPVVAEGHNGLPDSERGAFYHLSEGGEIFPLDWVLALETQVGTPRRAGPTCGRSSTTSSATG